MKIFTIVVFHSAAVQLLPKGTKFAYFIFSVDYLQCEKLCFLMVMTEKSPNWRRLFGEGRVKLRGG